MSEKALSRRFLFYISQNYSYEILRPLQSAIWAQGDEVRWLAIGDEIDTSRFLPDEVVCSSIDQAIQFKPDACFVPGNVIPHFIPGLKVQVFHGLEWKKKGHFVIRGCFDLYCTHGPATTIRFEQLAQQYGYFDVIETGWPKLDKLYSTPAYPVANEQKPVILYAPTFSPALTSAPELFEKIAEMIATKQHHWLIKFHPKMAKEWIEQYQALVSDNCQIIDEADINTLYQAADMLISDTSSVIGEFAMLAKPVLTYKNSAPGDYLYDIDNAAVLPEAVNKLLTPSSALLEQLAHYAEELHSFRDGKSSERILAAVEHILVNGKQSKKSKPLNLFRNLKQRQQLNYWRW